MSLVYLHTFTLVQLFMSQTFAASNSPFSNVRLVTSKIRYFKFRYLEFSRKIVNFSLKTLRKIFRKFNDFSWTNFVCITFAQYCTCNSTDIVMQFIFLFDSKNRQVEKLSVYCSLSLVLYLIRNLHG